MAHSINELEAAYNSLLDLPNTTKVDFKRTVSGIVGKLETFIFDNSKTRNKPLGSGIENTMALDVALKLHPEKGQLYSGVYFSLEKGFNEAQNIMKYGKYEQAQQSFLNTLDGLELSAGQLQNLKNNFYKNIFEPVQAAMKVIATIRPFENNAHRMIFDGKTTSEILASYEFKSPYKNALEILGEALSHVKANPTLIVIGGFLMAGFAAFQSLKTPNQSA